MKASQPKEKAKESENDRETGIDFGDWNRIRGQE
jgi:hypothetical protein